MSPPVFSDLARSELMRLLTWRRDVRAFRPDPLPPDVLDRLIAAACLSPSVGLSEPWRFVVVEAPDRRASILANFQKANSEALEAQDGSRRSLYAKLKLSGLQVAPVQIAAFADPEDGQGHGLGRRTMPDTVDYSVAIAIHTLWLAARAEGIGLGWVSILDPEPINATLDVPEAWRLIGYLCLGYPEFADERPALERAGWEARRDHTCRVLRR